MSKLIVYIAIAFLTGIIAGTVISYELFSVELTSQLRNYDLNRTFNELRCIASAEASGNMKKINGINIIEESDLVNYDKPNKFYHEKEDGMDFICNPRINIRFRVKEEDLHIPVSQIVDGLNDGSIKFQLGDVKFE